MVACGLNSQAGSANCPFTYVINGMTYTEDRATTYEDCEQRRRHIEQAQSSLGQRVIVHPCQCQPTSSNSSNSDFTQPFGIPNTKGPNFDGPGQGEAYTTNNNPQQNQKNWHDEQDTRTNAHNSKKTTVITARTGKKNFDNEYERLITKDLKNPKEPSRKLDVDMYSLREYVKSIFMGDEMILDFCKLVEKSFIDQMGYSPDKISFLNGMEK